MHTLAQLGERAVIARLQQRLGTRPDVRCGIGDDAAVVSTSAGEELVLTSDAVLQGRHFLASDAPAAIGHKAIGRVLSDLAAMGAAPRWALVNLQLPASTPMPWLEALYDGAGRLAATHGLAIIGGDTTEAAPPGLHVFAVGTVPAGTAALRSGARPGDVLCVSGSLGGSRAGRHLRFEPRVAQGLWLRGRIHAMIDLSDGLATDVGHLADQSAVGIELDADRIPCSPDLPADLPPDEALRRALGDGEDYELLFTLPAADAPALLTAWSQQWTLPCRIIGRVTAEPGCVFLVDRAGKRTPLTVSGFEHFQPSATPPPSDVP